MEKLFVHVGGRVLVGIFFIVVSSTTFLNFKDL